MHISEAIALITHDIDPQSASQTWADLGSGTGMFTQALAHLIPAGSTIYAIDKDRAALANIPTRSGNAHIIQQAGDFTNTPIPSRLNGILMANSLHYVRDKRSFIENLRSHLKPSGSFLIVEYDTDRSNPWVPFPITFERLRSLFQEVGFSSVAKLQERPSRYGLGNLYGALVN